MSEKPQDSEQEPTQKTPKGYEIPVPKHEDLRADLRKIVGPAKPLKKP